MPRSGSRHGRFWQRFYREEDSYDEDHAQPPTHPQIPPPPPPPNSHSCRWMCSVPLRRTAFNRRHSSTFPDVYSSHSLSPPRRWSSVDDKQNPNQESLDDLYEEIPASSAEKACFICGDVVSSHPEVPTIHLCDSGDFVVRIDNSQSHAVGSNHGNTEHHHIQSNRCHGSCAHCSNGDHPSIDVKDTKRLATKEISNTLKECQDNLSTTCQDIHMLCRRLKRGVILNNDLAGEKKTNIIKEDFGETLVQELKDSIQSYCDVFLSKIKDEILVSSSELTAKINDVEKQQLILEKNVAAIDIKKTKLEGTEMEFKEMRQKFESERTKFCKDRDKDREEISQQWKKLGEEIKQMEIVHQLQESRIKLDVGGHQFVTSVDTLTRDPDSMLAAMFSGRHQIKYEDDGSVFIDRDGTHFRYILNFLRDGACISSLPDSNRILHELKSEATYYQINGLCEAINDKFQNTG